MHSFLYSRRAGGPHISALFYTCNMQKRENKAIFLRISGETAKNEGICSRQQNATEVCRASRPANTPARLAAWTASQNYVLLFSQPSRQYNHAKHSAAAGNNLSSAVILFTEQISVFHQSIAFLPARPANTLPSFFFTEQILIFRQPTPFLPARPANTPRRHIFPYQASQPSFIQQPTTAGRLHLSAANTLPLFTSFLLSFCKYFSFF